MAYAVTYQLGQEAIFHYAAADGTASPSFTAFGLVRTNAWSIERNPVEGNYRDSMWTNTRAGQGKIPMEITGRRKVTDTTYIAMKAAVKAAVNSVIAVKLIPLSGSTDEIINAEMTVLKLACSEEMDSFQDFTLTMALNIDSRAPTIT